VDEAVVRFERAVAMADAADLYSAAWLTAACAPLLRSHAPGTVREQVARYAARVATLGYEDMTRRYAGLTQGA